MKQLKWPARTALSPIGIDIDGRSINAVQLSRHGASWHIEAATTLARLGSEYPPNSAEIERLSGVLVRQGFKGNRVVLAVPNDKLLTGVLDSPPASSGAPVDQIARIEIARMHKCEPGTFELAHWELPHRQRGTGGNASDRGGSGTVMAVAFPYTDAAPLMDVFEQHGWDVQALDAQCWAMLRACQSSVSTAPSAISPQANSAALLALRWNSAAVVLRHQDVVVYQRVLDDSGVAPVHRSLMEQAGLSAELADLVLTNEGMSVSRPEARKVLGKYFESIANDVRTSCAYMGHRYADSTPKLLLAMGEGAVIPGMAEYLARELDMEVRAAAPIELSTAPQCPAPLMYAYSGSRGATLTMAMGLAMWTNEAQAAPTRSEAA